MANITIVKLKVRRGTDAQRKEIILDQGEVGYTLDSKRLFVGDGASYGGKVAGNVNVGPFASEASLGPATSESPFLQVGDIGYANSKLYILTGASHTGEAYTNTLCGWGYIGNVPDNTFIGFDSNNKLTIKKQSLDGQYLGSSFFGDGLLSSNSSASVALNADYLVLSSDSVISRITPKVGSITKRELASFTDTTSGIKGGATTDGVIEPIMLNVFEKQFGFDDNKRLVLNSVGSLTIPVSTFAGGGTGTLLGGGLQVTTANQLEAAFQSVDTDILALNNGVLTTTGATSGYQEMPYINVQKGLVTDVQSSIWDVITATGLSGTGFGDNVPVGTILPHAQAFTTPPAGYLLCDGSALNATANPEYTNLFDKIGTVYGGTGKSNFLIPKLTGSDVMLYGAGAAIENPYSTTNVRYLSATDAEPGATHRGPDTKPPYNVLSAFGVNFIIKYAEDPIFNIFNGAPNQVRHRMGGKYSQQVCIGEDSAGNGVSLSSAGFITMSLSGKVRDPSSNETFNRFAIPVYSY